MKIKGYKTLRNEILHWAKTRCLDTIKVLYHPDNELFMKAFETEWNKDAKCKDFSLEIFTHESFKEKNLVPKDAPILTGKDSKAIAGVVYGDFLPYISSGVVTK